MIRGLYTAGSGMVALENRQEALANNLVNINTPGYKQNEGVLRAFPEELLMRMNDEEGPEVKGYPKIDRHAVQIGRLHQGVYMSESISNFIQGDIAESNNPYDVALTDNLPIPENAPLFNRKPVQPKLFVSVAKLENANGTATAEQIRYGRNGNWNVNPQGYLVNSDGYYLLGNDNRPIQISDDTGLLDGKITIDADGLVHLSDGTTRQLGLVKANNPYQMVREGNNVFRPQNPEDVQALEDTDTGRYAIRQGWIERANVDPIRTMTDMMTVMRSYEANQRVITTLDGTMDKAVNEVGRVT
ncbi:flagellar hook-basal body protein [Brevibacillus laterosporus]|uniref:flagellar hook-basal body protein n=1 Tax=Brevibacillus laterosporus TaxID=1465 RepID=UPI0035A71DED